MVHFIKIFEKWIIVALLGMMMLAVFFSTVELAILLVREILNPPVLLLDIKEMLEVFGFFLMVLIGLELLETIKAYMVENKLHVEIVLLVAIIAVARKVIILDLKSLTPEILIGISAVIAALSGGFFLIKKAIKS